MDWLSIVLVVLLVLLVFRSWRNGLVRELVGLIALIIAVPIASLFYGDLVPKVEPITDNLKLANLVAFLAIVLGVVLVSFWSPFWGSFWEPFCRPRCSKFGPKDYQHL